jgi:hypothetical protein
VTWPVLRGKRHAFNMQRQIIQNKLVDTLVGPALSHHRTPSTILPPRGRLSAAAAGNNQALTIPYPLLQSLSGHHDLQQPSSNSLRDN